MTYQAIDDAPTAACAECQIPVELDTKGLRRRGRNRPVVCRACLPDSEISRMLEEDMKRIVRETTAAFDAHFFGGRE